MNTSILNKCITELNKDNVDLSYLRGMLETLLEMQDSATLNPPAREIYGGLSSLGQKLVSGSNFPPMGKIVSNDSPAGLAVEEAINAIAGMPKPKVGIQEKNTILN